jgi:hypothetical protein
MRLGNHATTVAMHDFALGTQALITASTAALIIFLSPGNFFPYRSFFSRKGPPQYIRVLGS